jgi:hypothetical protein
VGSFTRSRFHPGRHNARWSCSSQTETGSNQQRRLDEQPTIVTIWAARAMASICLAQRSHYTATFTLSRWLSCTRNPALNPASNTLIGKDGQWLRR